MKQTETNEMGIFNIISSSECSIKINSFMNNIPGFTVDVDLNRKGQGKVRGAEKGGAEEQELEDEQQKEQKKREQLE